MIDRTLVRKYVGQASLLWIPLAILLFVFAWIRVWVVSLLDMSQFQAVLEQLREYEKFAPIPFDRLFTYEGRVGMTFDEPVVILCIVVWCVARGSDVISGELNRGTLEMLLAQPISRMRLLMSHAVVSIVGLVLLALLLWAGMWCGVQATTVTEQPPPPSLTVPFTNLQIPLSAERPDPVEVEMADRVDTRVYAPAIVNIAAFGFFLLGLSSLVSCIDRYRWRTVGVVIGFYIIQLVMFGLGKAQESLEWLLRTTFFSFYRPQELAQYAINRNTIGPWSLFATDGSTMLPPLAYTLALVGLGLGCYVFAALYLRARDLPAPL